MSTVTNQIYNPITKVFGSGNVMVYAGSTALTGAQTVTTFTWTVPAGTDAVRVRLWGGGGNNGGAGGGFAIKSIYGISGTVSILISVGYGGNATTTTGGTSSFGSFVSATGGVTSTGAVGTGTGGDINTSGGLGGGTGGGGGAGSIFGNGGSSINASTALSTYGGGGASNGTNTPGSNLPAAGSGFIGSGGAIGGDGTGIPIVATVVALPASGLSKFSIDFLGTGGAGIATGNGRNGGAGAITTINSISGGTPGGGGGGGATGLGAPGLVIVEW
jgi:hypothetical protein